jgi:ubiquinone/menaquinone biosynthesis C-methylase UbiE
VKTNWIERIWVNGPFRIMTQKREVAAFRRLHPLQAQARVLEIGCGRGRGARLIEKAFFPSAIDAVDIDPHMIRLAERDQRRHGPRSGTFQVADAQSLPFPDASMDAVFNFGIIHHLEDWEAGIREVARVLKPGGVFYFEEIFPALYANFIFRLLLPHPRENRFDGPAYRAALERAGLSLKDGYRETRLTIVGACVASTASRRASGRAKGAYHRT